MKIFAYVHNAYDFFFPIFTNPLVKEWGHEFAYVDMWKYLLNQYEGPKLIDPLILEMFWDNLLKSHDFDVLLGYNIPDEVTDRKCKKAGIPYLVIEGFGRTLPGWGMVWPKYADFKAHYKNKLKETPIIEQNVDTLQITLALTWEPLPIYTIPYAISNMKTTKNSDLIVSFSPFWHTSDYTCNNYNLCQVVVEACRQADFSKPWRLNIRPHPEKQLHFAPALNMLTKYVEELDDPRIQLDNEAGADWYEKTHILICLNSSTGCEALKRGCEVVTFENRAWYAHPQLTYTPHTPNELTQTFKILEEKIRGAGKRKAPLMAALEEDLTGTLACKADKSIHAGSPEEQQENLKKLFSAIEYAKSFPLLKYDDT